MTLSFFDPPPAERGAVQALEARTGVQLPRSFRDLLTGTSNGGVVAPVAMQSAPQVGLVAMFGAGREDDLDIERCASGYGSDRLGVGMLPIADAEGGNLVCLSVRPDDFGSVWFWDHEGELPGNAAELVAADFDAFLEDLAPLDLDGPPITVLSVWVDPALRAELDPDGTPPPGG